MNSQNFNLDALAALCSEKKIIFHRTTNDELEITVASDCVLIFRNLTAENDTIAGFKGTPWHFHGTLDLMTSDSTYIEYDEQQIIHGILSGDIVILSRYLGDKLDDRWLAHKAEKIDVKYIQADEEMRVKRLF